MSSRLYRRTRIGFTLIELIVTIVILGVLAALAVPAFSAVTERSRDATDQATWEAVGREAAALAALDQTGVTADHIATALADAGLASEVLVAAPAATYTAVADSPAAGQYAYAAAGRAGYITAVPHRITGATRVIYVRILPSGAATAAWSAPDHDASGVTDGADAVSYFTGNPDATAPAPSPSATPVAAAPDAPTNVTATVSDQQVTLTWTAAVDNGSAVTAYTATGTPSGQVVTTGGDVVQATFSSLAAGEHTFSVVATNAVGDSPAGVSNTVTVAEPVPGPGSQTFTYTGGVQTFVVPAGKTTITVDAYGAAAGSAWSTALPGNGGRVRATIPVTAGETLRVYVGGAGANATSTATAAGGWNGGGTGAIYYGGGGGATDLRRGTTLSARLVVAGGGGGGGNNSTESGGHGGGLTGQNGLYLSTGTAIGYGGTQTAGGAGGSTRQAGGFGYGGGFTTETHTAAGGGGWYGGGAAYAAAAGGGSSYTVSGATGVSHWQGVQSGNGRMVISWG